MVLEILAIAFSCFAIGFNVGRLAEKSIRR